MSSPVSNARASYASILNHAQLVYDNSSKLLDKLAAGKEVEESVTSQIHLIDVRTDGINNTSKDPEIYKGLKLNFIEFTNAQLEAYETVQKARKSGLEAIDTIQKAFATCTAFKPKAEEFLNHLTGIGFPTNHYLKCQSDAEKLIADYRFNLQIQMLTALVDKVTQQIPALEASLDKAFFARKGVEGKVGLYDLFPAYSLYYLNAAIRKKQKQAQLKKEPAIANA